MNKEVLKQKLEEIKSHLATLFSKVKEIQTPEIFNNPIGEKFHEVCDYVEQNKIICISLAVLFVWNLIISALLLGSLSKFATAPSGSDLVKARNDIKELSEKIDYFENNYIYKIQDIQYAMEKINPRLESLEDYSHTHY
jgi:hypothetical protein